MNGWNSAMSANIAILLLPNGVDVSLAELNPTADPNRRTTAPLSLHRYK